MSTISRRRFLGGAGALLALPFFESAQARSLWRSAAAAPSPPRLIVFYFPCGRNVASWVPTSSGTSFALPQSLTSFSSLQNKMICMQGLTGAPGINSVNIGDHARGTGTVFTGMPILNGQSFVDGISIDQQIAASQSAATRFRSLQWTAGAPNVCDINASCIYTQCISWADKNTPLSPISDPLAAYNQLFAGSDPGATAAQQASMKSVLDYVLTESKSFSSTLNKSDQSKLDEYLTSVRTLETNLFAPASASCNPGTAPGSALDYPSTVKAFNDMMVMALQCNLTQVISFMIEFDISYRSHPFINVPTGHHALTHTPGQDALNQLVAVETWQAEQLQYLANKLQSTQDAGGAPLLDNTLILASSSMGQGSVHDHNNIAPMLIGNINGRLKTGQALDFKQQQPMNNLMVSLLQTMGVGQTSFGADSTGPLAGLLA